MRTRDSITIGWCDPGNVDGEFAFALALLASQRTARLGPLVRVEGSAMISKLRNHVVAKYLEQSSAEWLLFLDSDQVLSIEAFDRLVKAAHESERPVVGGLCFAGFQGGDLYPIPVPAMYRDGGDGEWAPVDDYPRDTVVEVDAVGTGCLLVHRSILELIRAEASDDEGTNWCWFADGPVGGQWVGEDFIFSNRITQLGYPLHVDTGAVLPHRKRYWLDQPHHDRIVELRRMANEGE